MIAEEEPSHKRIKPHGCNDWPRSCGVTLSADRRGKPCKI
jgi:hypothetical protein